MIRNPLAGNMLAYFQYVLGLHRLGHEVVYLEESGWSYSCYDPLNGEYGDDPHPGLGAVRALFAAHGLDIPIVYVNRDSGLIHGAERGDLKGMLRATDLLLNLGGVCWLPEFHLCSRRALVDMDPLFTQIGRFGGEGMDYYHAYFTYGANIGRPSCTVPTGGVDWVPTVPPVVPEVWQTVGRSQFSQEGVFTTVASWSAYGATTYQGHRYGQKDEEFLRLLDLPRRTSQKLELALSGTSAEVAECLRAAGWRLRNGGEVSRDVRTYQSYIVGSRGEFSAAKHAYVRTRSGWFSDRSVCYLAAGLPVILQDTGFTDWLPSGRGVLAFSSLEEAASCLERVDAEYEAHRRAANEIAGATFGYRTVLPQLVDAALGPTGGPGPVGRSGGTE